MAGRLLLDTNIIIALFKEKQLIKLTKDCEKRG